MGGLRIVHRILPCPGLLSQRLRDLRRIVSSRGLEIGRWVTGKVVARRREWVILVILVRIGVKVGLGYIITVGPITGVVVVGIQRSWVHTRSSASVVSVAVAAAAAAVRIGVGKSAVHPSAVSLHYVSTLASPSTKPRTEKGT
jgi:hypothetical protein